MNDAATSAAVEIGSRWKPYLAYKESGVEWLGAIPAYWEVKRLKFLTSFVTSGSRGWAQYYSENGAIFLRIGNLLRTSIDLDLRDIQYVCPPQDAEGERTRVNQHDVLISITAYIGSVAVVAEGIGEAYVNQHIALTRPRKEVVVPKWLGYCLLSQVGREQFRLLLYGGTKDGLGLDDVNNLLVLMPPICEQDAIASFLDCETAHIDALIAKKERLIELLTEKRSALISHTVTKGLDPTVPMKDLGVEWLGQIPQHWEVTRLKFLTPEITVGIVVTPAKYYVDNGIPCLRSLNVREDGLKDTELVFISAESNHELRKSMIFTGDLVSVRTGQPGTTAIVDERFHRANCIDLIITRQSQNFNSHFMVYLLNSPIAKEQYGIGAEGAIQKHFNIETAKNLSVMLPSKDEQDAIVAFLDCATSKIDALISKIRTHIEKLKEYRTALISAAITGKIDVREEIA